MSTLKTDQCVMTYKHLIHPKYISKSPARY